jgi:hypothetical protein
MVYITSSNAYSSVGNSLGVIPGPYVNSLGGDAYKYASSAGGRTLKSTKTTKKTKKARKNRRSRKTRINR